MKKVRNNLGFTLAEVMVVVAIVVVLAGVGTVSITAARRNLHHREMDSYAKEVFVAAQNHLSMAKSEGALSEITGDARGSQSATRTAETAQGVYYFVVGADGSYPDQSATLRALDLMLPFGSIDDNVRLGGSYIIRYQFATARVLDVFYTEDDVLRSGDYDELMKDTYRSMDSAGKEARKKYSNNGVEADVGWFGGAQATDLPTAQRLSEPTIEVVNGAKLLVKVANPNLSAGEGYELKLIITGLTSHNQCTVVVIPASGSAPAWVTRTSPADYSSFTVTLDDVTGSTMHFDQVANHGITDAAKQLIPGEDITVQAVADYTNKLSNVARSSGVTTNSLFASVQTVTVPDGGLTDRDPLKGQTLNDARVIGNFRHLENLDYYVSGFKAPAAVTALQIADLDWATFRSDINAINGNSGSVSVVTIKTGTPNSTGRYCPVEVSDGSNPAALQYFGMDVDCKKSEMRLIRGVSGETMAKTAAAAAGVFGYLKNAQLKDVTAVDFSVTSTAGAAGGLVGELNGGSVQFCGAASRVSGSIAAGGLIGRATGSAAVSDSYAGGRTVVQKNKAGSVSCISAYSTEDYNVTSTGGAAGGLIGQMSGSVGNCYSTCSAVGGSYAGGLVGSGDCSIINCYATGLVSGSDGKGALLGSGDSDFADCRYLSCINGEKVFAVGGATKQAVGVTCFDRNRSAYQQMAKSAAGAAPFNELLQQFTHYEFTSVRELNASAPDWMQYHYGDWPVPDTLIVNQPN